MNRRKKFVWLLVGCWLAVGFVSVAQADFDDGFAALMQGDYDTAFKELKPLAEQGDAKAQNTLGYMYNKGQGVPQDYVLAYMWINLAATQGGKFAVQNRDIAAKKMTSEQIAEAEILAREWKPKE